MTSERQREANRRNARKSTGPRTTLGREISALNATRHGLTSREPEGAVGKKTQALALEIEKAWPGRREAALAVAKARRRLERVRAFRLRMIEAAIEQGMPDDKWGGFYIRPDQEVAGFTRCLWDLKVVDTYERKLMSQLHRAVADLSEDVN